MIYFIVMCTAIAAAGIGAGILDRWHARRSWRSAYAETRRDYEAQGFVFDAAGRIIGRNRTAPAGEPPAQLRVRK